MLCYRGPALDLKKVNQSCYSAWAYMHEILNLIDKTAWLRLSVLQMCLFVKGILLTAEVAERVIVLCASCVPTFLEETASKCVVHFQIDK